MDEWMDDRTRRPTRRRPAKNVTSSFCKMTIPPHRSDDVARVVDTNVYIIKYGSTSVILLSETPTN